MSVARCAAASLLCAALAGACGTEPSGDVDGPWTAETEERGDTLVVRTVSGSVWGDTMGLVPEVAIGALDGADPYVFGQRLAGLDVGPDGRVVVLDAQARDVRVFSPEGEHILTFGRAGEGPGEFVGPNGLKIASDGRIVVRDGFRRFSVFSPDGTFEGGWPLNTGFGSGAPFYLDPDDRVLNPTLQDRLVWYGLHGEALDTVPVPSVGFEPPTLEVSSENGRAWYSLPFTSAEHWALTREGAVLFGLNERYRLERRNPDGSVRRIERVVDPVPVTGGEAEQARENILRMARTMAPSWRWQGEDIPSTKPPYVSFFPGADGTIWVRRATPAVEEENPSWDPEAQGPGSPTRWREPVVLDVFDAEGRYLGPVSVPDGFRFYPEPVLTEDGGWGVTAHEMGYLQVVRFRLGSPEEAGS